MSADRAILGVTKGEMGRRCEMEGKASEDGRDMSVVGSVAWRWRGRKSEWQLWDDGGETLAGGSVTGDAGFTCQSRGTKPGSVSRAWNRQLVARVCVLTMTRRDE